MSKIGKRLGAQSCLIVTGVLAGCSIFMAPCSVQAQAQDAAPQPAHDGLAIYSQAGADQAELDKIKAIGMDFEKKAQGNYQSLMEAIRDMQTMSLDPTLDETKLLATQDKINKMTAEMSTDRIKQLIAVRKALTPEQRVKLVDLLKKRREANSAGLGRQQ
jgi:Spy/CpxP family protein refolding chaperone